MTGNQTAQTARTAPVAEAGRVGFDGAVAGGGSVGVVLTGAGMVLDPAVTTVTAPTAGGGGPLLSAAVVDPAGEVVAVVAVTDTGDDAETLLSQAVRAAADDLDGGVGPTEPVATAAELGARFTMPTTTRCYTTPTSTAYYITATNRRTTTPPPTTQPPDTAPSDTQPSTPAAGGSGRRGGLDKLINVSLDVSVELGRTTVTLAEVLDYDVGSIIELDRPAGAPVDIRVNDTLLAQGEVVLIDDEYAVRITAIFDPHQQS